jgi:hypothetical protein
MAMAREYVGNGVEITILFRVGEDFLGCRHVAAVVWAILLGYWVGDDDGELLRVVAN